MPKYKLVIFDSDGTLADTLPWSMKAFWQVAASLELKLRADVDLEHLRELTAREALDYLGVPLWRVPALVAGVRRLMAGHVHEFSLFDGIATSLWKLSDRGALLGVVSSNSRENVRAILGPKNSALIQFYACGASLFGKPSRLRTVLRASGVAAGDAIYVGDEVRDAEAARKAGLAFGAVAWGYHRLETLRRFSPAGCFEHPRQIGEQLG